MAQGTVKFFNSQKGFGFIQPTDGGKDVFVHISAVERAGMSSLNEGQKLSYDVVSEARQACRSKPAEHLIWAMVEVARRQKRRAICRSESVAVGNGRQVALAAPKHRRPMGAGEMAKKPASRAEFVMFDVVYEDGSRRSNRRVPSVGARRHRRRCARSRNNRRAGPGYRRKIRHSRHAHRPHLPIRR